MRSKSRGFFELFWNSDCFTSLWFKNSWKKSSEWFIIIKCFPSQCLYLQDIIRTIRLSDNSPLDINVQYKADESCPNVIEKGAGCGEIISERTYSFDVLVTASRCQKNVHQIPTRSWVLYTILDQSSVTCRVRVMLAPQTVVIMQRYISSIWSVM